MKKLLYVVIFLPILLTGAAFSLVLSGERKLVKSMTVPLPIIGEPTTSNDPLVKKGQEVYNSKGCVYCHGPNGSGGVKNPNAQGGEIPGLTKISSGYSPEELKTKILAGVREIGKENPAGPAPPLNMPVWKGHISDEDLAAVVAFLNSLAPAGGEADEF